MEVFESCHDLCENVLLLNSFKASTSSFDGHLLYGCREVGFYELHLDVDIFLGGRFGVIQKLDDIWVIQFLQIHYLSVGALAVSGVPERIENFFEGANIFVFLVDGFPNLAVRPFAYFFHYFVFLQYLAVDQVIHHNNK